MNPSLNNNLVNMNQPNPSIGGQPQWPLQSGTQHHSYSQPAGFMVQQHLPSPGQYPQQQSQSHSSSQIPVQPQNHHPVAPGNQQMTQQGYPHQQGMPFQQNNLQGTFPHAQQYLQQPHLQSHMEMGYQTAAAGFQNPSYAQPTHHQHPTMNQQKFMHSQHSQHSQPGAPNQSLPEPTHPASTDYPHRPTPRQSSDMQYHQHNTPRQDMQYHQQSTPCQDMQYHQQSTPRQDMQYHQQSTPRQTGTEYHHPHPHQQYVQNQGHATNQMPNTALQQPSSHPNLQTAINTVANSNFLQPQMMPSANSFAQESNRPSSNLGFPTQRSNPQIMPHQSPQTQHFGAKSQDQGPQGAPTWCPTNQKERTKYDMLFSNALQLQPKENQIAEKLGGKQAVQFLMSSGLSREMLHEIWAICDPSSSGILNRSGFYCCMRLVAMAQNGFDPSKELLLSLGARQLPPPLLGASPPSVGQGTPEKLKNPFELLDHGHAPTQNSAVQNHMEGTSEFTLNTVESNLMPPMTLFSEPNDDEDFGEFTSASVTMDAAGVLKDEEPLNDPEDDFGEFCGTSKEPENSTRSSMNMESKEEMNLAQLEGELPDALPGDLQNEAAISENKTDQAPKNSFEGMKGLQLKGKYESFGDIFKPESGPEPTLNNQNDMEGQTTDPDEWGDFEEVPKPVMMANNEEVQKNKFGALFDLVESDLKAQEEDWEDFTEGEQGFQESSSNIPIQDGGHQGNNSSAELMDNINTELFSIHLDKASLGDNAEDWNAFEDSLNVRTADTEEKVAFENTNAEWDAFDKVSPQKLGSEFQLTPSGIEEEQWNAFEEPPLQKNDICGPSFHNASSKGAEEEEWNAFEEPPSQKADASDLCSHPPTSLKEVSLSNEKEEWNAFEEPPLQKEDGVVGLSPKKSDASDESFAIEKEEWSAFEKPSLHKGETSEDNCSQNQTASKEDCLDTEKEEWNVFEEPPPQKEDAFEGLPPMQPASSDESPVGTERQEGNIFEEPPLQKEDAFEGISAEKPTSEQLASLDAGKEKWKSSEDLPSSIEDPFEGLSPQKPILSQQGLLDAEEEEWNAFEEPSLQKEDAFEGLSPPKPVSLQQKTLDAEEEEWNAFEEPPSQKEDAFEGPSPQEPTSLPQVLLGAEEEEWNAFEVPPSPEDTFGGNSSQKPTILQGSSPDGKMKEWNGFEEPPLHKEHELIGQDSTDVNKGIQVKQVDDSKFPAPDTSCASSLPLNPQIPSSAQNENTTKNETADENLAPEDKTDTHHQRSSNLPAKSAKSINIVDEDEDPWIVLSEPSIKNQQLSLDEDGNGIPTEDLLFMDMNDSAESTRTNPVFALCQDFTQLSNLTETTGENCGQDFLSMTPTLDDQNIPHMGGQANGQLVLGEIEEDEDLKLPRMRSNYTRPGAKQHLSRSRDNSTEQRSSVPVLDKLLKSLVISYYYEEAIRYYEHLQACKLIEEQNEAKAAAVAQDQFELAIEIREQIRLLQSKKASDAIIASWKEATKDPKPSVDVMAAEALSLDEQGGAQFVSQYAENGSLQLPSTNGVEGFTLGWLWEALKRHRSMEDSFRVFKLLRGPCKDYPSSHWKKVFGKVKEEVQKGIAMLEQLLAAECSKEQLACALSTPKFNQFCEGLVEMMNVTRRIQASSESAFVPVSSAALESTWASYCALSSKLKISVDQKVKSTEHIREKFLQLPLDAPYFFCNLCLQAAANDEGFCIDSQCHIIWYCNTCANLWTHRISSQLPGT